MVRKLFSMKMAIVVMLIFAAAIGYATFLENDYGTQTAKALIYNARWFEVLLLYFMLIMIYNIFKFKMYKRPKWAQFTLHFAFVLIALGALITRFIGYEGVMHLRDKQTSNTMLSNYMSLNIGAKVDGESYEYNKDMILSSKGGNSYSDTIKVKDKEINVKLLKYLASAKKGVIENQKDGKDTLELVVAGGGKARETLYLQKGDFKDLGNFVVDFESGKQFSKPVVSISNKQGKYFINIPFDVNTKSMDTLQDAHLTKGEHEFKNRTLYSLGATSLVFKKAYKNAKVDLTNASLKSGGKYPQMIELNVSSGNESKVVQLFGKSSAAGETKHIKLNGMDLYLNYGPKEITLPFALRLDKFELQRYPGSMTPSEYSSYVTVIDKNKSFDYHIYMNHVLDYKGYRFFQSSYDMDEKGSILSVNHDPGTLPTYIGYLLLAIGFIWSYLSDKGRIKTLLKRLRKLEAKNSAVALLALFMLTLSQSAYSASIDTSKLTQDELKTITSISKEHANNYSRLIVQSNGGRMEPLDTLNKEVVRKLSSKSGFLGLDYNQITIGMLVNPDIYKKLRFIKVTHPLIAKKIGLDKSAKYASFDDFFTDNGKGDYKLLKDVDIAKKKRPALQNVYDKELIKIDEKLNVLYLYQQGFLLKLFPKPNDPNNSWYNPIDAMKSFSSKDSQVVKFLMGSYFESVLKAQKDGNWTNADKTVHMIANFQKFYGSAVIPPKEKVDAEIFYNRVDIFSKLILAYIGIGLVLLVTAFVSIVKPKLNVKIVTRVATALLVVVFLIHTAGLILRWYIAGHAPWSNAYESILFIAWATALAGFVFAKKSPISFAATSILAGVFLFVAFLSSLNPQITNLVPVLKSYWLMIHVAVITSSYGFLALGALLGMFVLALFIIDRNRQTPHIIRAVKELTIINEITLIIGLGLLTVGNFLGGVWANESWGRYWGWDPKETWAAVTILVYAAVVHMRFVPALNSIYKFNVAAILAYFSVIMTYFGVNYYLSGMHSYAAGDPVPIPVWTYYAVAFVFLLIIVAKRFEVKGKL